MSDLELSGEVESARRTISSDSYPMSIGELTNLFKEGELIIDPAFQRLFRWNQGQKSRLIESILLGIPLPSIFVSQLEDGKWELVDGLQRVSTLLELQGLLPSGDLTRPPLVLSGTKYLASLEGRHWGHAADGTGLGDALERDIKRSKIDLKIIKRESSVAAKYDLFQRLNSYGSTATAQELRSAMLVGTSVRFFHWVEELSKLPAFVMTTSLGDRPLEEQFDLELVLRFLVLHNRKDTSRRALRNFTQLIDDASIQLATEFDSVQSQLDTTFRQTFELLAEHLGESAFRRPDPDSNSTSGGFLTTAFEVVAMGVGYHIANSSPLRSDITEGIAEFWREPVMRKGFATGRATEDRLVEMLPLGRMLMGQGALA